MLNSGAFQLLMRDMLNSSIQREHKVLALPGCANIFYIFDNPALVILNHTPLANFPLQYRVPSMLDPFLSTVFNIGKTDNVRRHFPFGVVTLELCFKCDTFNFEISNTLRNFGHNPALEVHKTPFFPVNTA